MLLPTPLDPTNATISPGVIVAEMPRRTGWPGKYSNCRSRSSSVRACRGSGIVPGRPG